VLQQLGISKLVIVGMQIEFCVDTTCRRAFSIGYETILVEDAHST
jgi:nicotinamidase-related amidase